MRCLWFSTLNSSIASAIVSFRNLKYLVLKLTQYGHLKDIHIYVFRVMTIQTYGLNVCGPWNSYIEAYTPNLMVLGHEDPALMIRIDALIKRERHRSLCSLLCKDTSRQPAKGQQTISSHQVCSLSLDFPATRTTRPSSLVYNCLVCGALFQQPELRAPVHQASRFLLQSLIQWHWQSGLVLHKCKPKLQDTTSHPLG